MATTGRAAPEPGQTRVFAGRDGQARPAVLTAHHTKPVRASKKETYMRQSPIQPRRLRNHPRLNTAWNALLWISVIALAVFPFPWWW
jgi:hypothetical protein